MKKLVLFLALSLALVLPAYLTGTADPLYAMRRSVVALSLDPLGRIGSGVVVSQTQEALGCRIAVVTAGHVAGIENVTLDAHVPIVVSLHRHADVALMVFVVPQACENTGYTAAVIDTGALRPMDRLLHVGFPRGEYMMGYTHYITTVDLEGEVLGSMASIGGPGSSGGAVFRRGKLVGILARGETVQPFRNYFVPIDKLFDVVPPVSARAGFSIRSIAVAVSAAAS